jgi:hypothetical protein
VTAFVVGIAACGVSLALAGTTPKPPADPIDNLPGDLERIRDFACARDLLTAVMPTTTVETLGTTSGAPCWRVALVWSTREGSNQLADRLAGYFTARGYKLNGPTTGDFRSYYGTLAECGTILAIDTGTAAASAAPGARSALPVGVDPNTGLPTGASGPTVPGVVPGAPVPGAGTSESTTAPLDPSGALGPGVSTLPGNGTGFPPDEASTPDVSLDPRMSPDQILLNDPYSAPTLLARTSRPAMAMISVQQARSVAPAGASC